MAEICSSIASESKGTQFHNVNLCKLKEKIKDALTTKEGAQEALLNSLKLRIEAVTR